MGRHRRALIAGIVAMLTLAACGGGGSSSSSGKALTIGFVVKDFQVPFWIAMRNGASQEAQKKGVQLIFEAGKFAGDNATQISDISDFITRHVDAIVVAPSESAGIVPAVTRATQAGIPVLAVDTDTDPASAVKSFIATDSFKAGVLTGGLSHFSGGELNSRAERVRIFGTSGPRTAPAKNPGLAPPPSPEGLNSISAALTASSQGRT